jgi:hypothetical protein
VRGLLGEMCTFPTIRNIAGFPLLFRETLSGTVFSLSFELNGNVSNICCILDLRNWKVLVYIL